MNRGDATMTDQRPLLISMMMLAAFVLAAVGPLAP